MDSLHYAGRTTRTLHLDLEMPPELRSVLQRIADRRTDEDETTEVIVTIAGVRVGKVNLYARQWRHLVSEQY